MIEIIIIVFLLGVIVGTISQILIYKIAIKKGNKWFHKDLEEFGNIMYWLGQITTYKNVEIE